MRDPRSHCLALAILALASGAVGASAAAVPTVLPFSATGIFFVAVVLIATTYLLVAPRLRAGEPSLTPYPTAAQWQTLRESYERLQEELDLQQQEAARLMEDKTLLQFLRADQDQERQRIAQDLHDHLLQHLAALLMYWETEVKKPKIEGKTLRSGVESLREVFRHGRRIMNRLSPSRVADEGVVASLQRLTATPTGSPLVATFQADTQFDRLTPLAEYALVYIARETLEHAGTIRDARQAHVELQQVNCGLRLQIRAFACGNPPSPTASDLLVQLTETAELIEAQIMLQDLPDSVQLYLEVPLTAWDRPSEKSSVTAPVVPERPARRL